MYSRTTEYYDDVLGAKMRSLVYVALSLPYPPITEVVPSSGAIKRTRLEKAEPAITYEAFVEDLDRGDSFTTSIIEVLVKVRVTSESCSYSGPTARRRRLQNAVIAPTQPIVVSLGTAPRGPCASYPVPHLSTVSVLPVADLVPGEAWTLPNISHSLQTNWTWTKMTTSMAASYLSWKAVVSTQICTMHIGLNTVGRIPRHLTI